MRYKCVKSYYTVLIRCLQWLHLTRFYNLKVNSMKHVNQNIFRLLTAQETQLHC